MGMSQSARAVQRTTVMQLGGAVHRGKALSREGILERLFTLAFRGLVYPQIWEDPVVDMEALKLGPNDRMITIASGGCNALSYLIANPAHVTAIDLNGAHVALTRLKLAAARSMPDHAAFRRFFANANDRGNIALYQNHARPALDATSRAYWDSRNAMGCRRIAMFASGFYRHGLLGRFIGAGHLVAKLYGVDPRIMLTAKTREEQRAVFERHLAPVFERPTLRWLLRQPASLYGLGIPPAQYRALAGDDEAGIGVVLRRRLEKLCCDFDLKSNYFAWQAFGRGYAPGPDAATPPYLERENFDAIRERADRVSVVHGSMTKHLSEAPAGSLDAYVLLDAQDWMTDADLSALWSEITRTARPGARVIFRTAADERLLPGRLPQDILDAWTYDEAASRDYGARDRSSIYGAFHLYTLKDERR
jgi:S-adenosylmethionine-diacylglycerol 3-amino-3-carboxypropyl transferase